MSRAVDYYFAPHSPWAYLGHERLARICAAGAKLIGRGPMTRSIVEEIVETCSSLKNVHGR